MSPATCYTSRRCERHEGASIPLFHFQILINPIALRQRTTRELYHWSKARHENIQELLGIVMFQDRLGMVSLWMENGNLQQYIEKNPSVERYPLVSVNTRLSRAHTLSNPQCVQVAKGVEYLHGIGMVSCSLHCDFRYTSEKKTLPGTW